MNQAAGASSDRAAASRDRSREDTPALLAACSGEPVPAPPWFRRALACEPERSFVRIEGANVELLAWGERGRPGLLFLHGHAAHADVWRFIAPFFAGHCRVGALSWSGMGRSDWRPQYHIDQWVNELMEGAAALGLFDAPVAPVVVAHSAGAKAVLITAARHGDRFGGLIVADSAVSGPAPPARRRETDRRRSHRIYPTLPEALQRFRFGPIQPCENLYIADRIARDSLKQVEGGWTWRFDPALWAWTAAEEAWNAMAHPRSRLALLVGEHSSVVTEQRAESLRHQAPLGTPYIVLPEAHHHLMVDQPLAFVTAIRAVLAGWGIAA
jgi:pimeloyl-ACP methyl ester carboxylesterase